MFENDSLDKTYNIKAVRQMLVLKGFILIWWNTCLYPKHITEQVHVRTTKGIKFV